MNSDLVITHTVLIDAPAQRVWQALTDTAQMQQWMAETPLRIITTWEPGTPITISGALYKKPFQNTGTVVAYQPPHNLQYTHLSSLSRLADTPENYAHLSFVLTNEDGHQTRLTLTITQLATDVIYKHLAFYWNVALVMLKKFIEGK